MIRHLPERLRPILQPLALGVLLLLILEVLSRAGAFPITIPAPSEVWSKFAAAPSMLWYHLMPTLIAAGAGLGLAFVVSTGLAAIGSIHASSRQPIYNMTVIIHAVPLIALTPLLVLWLGAGLTTRVIIAALACFFPILVNAMEGFRATDATADEMLHVFAANRWQRLRLLVLPTALPYLFAGLKIAAPAAILGTIISEWAGADRGLGILMLHALFAFQPPQLWLGIVICILVATSAYALVAALERLAVYWQDDSAVAELDLRN